MRELENVVSKNSISSVDVVFIDVEGFEFEVIKGIDFSKVQINCICVEAPCFDKVTKTIRRYLSDKGFTQKAHIGSDDIFQKKD